MLKQTTANEISSLTSSFETPSGFSEDLFNSEFGAAIESILAAGGKHKPLALADLNGFDTQQAAGLLAEIDIQLPEPINVNQLPANIFALNMKAPIDGVSSTGYPKTDKFLSTHLGSDELSEEGLLNVQTNKTLLFTKSMTSDTLQHSLVNKEPGLALALSESKLDLSEYLKKLTLDDIDLNGDLLTQTARQEISTSKLAEHLVSVDKPINPISAVNAQPVQAYINKEAAAVITQRIEVPVQQAGWGEAVGNRLMMMVNDKIQSAHIHLNPPELGPIEVRVNVNQDQASVHFVSSNSTVRDAIDDAFPRLKEMFLQNGITLSDANVSQQSPQHGKQNLSQQDDVSASQNNDSSSSEDIETVSSQSTSIGLIDQYV